MKKKSAKQEAHPVDEYFREQEPRIPVTFDEAHWMALQTMLRDEGHAGNIAPGGSAPAAHGSVPGAGTFRFLTILGILILLCSTAWMLVTYQQNREEPVREAPLGKTDPEGGADQKIHAPTGRRAIEQPASINISRDADNQLSKPGSTATAPDSIQAMAKALPKLDSLSILPPELPKDSLLAKPKKKKHLFW